MSWVKIEAVVIRERIETVIDAVEEHAGHVGVTVIEAVGHGRQRGITHEYRGRVFESRFLPKALLVFVAPEERVDAIVETIVDAARSGNESGDGIVWTTPIANVMHNRTGRALEEVEVRRMSNKDLLYAASTIWVVIAAFLVMFMQAGFAFLEAGLTRMKNVGHIAAKNVLIFALCSIVYYLVGFGIAFGDGGNGLVGGSGFFPNVEDLMSIGAAPFSWFSEIPGAAGYMFEVVFAGVSLAIVWGAMAERTKLYVYIVFGVLFTLDLLGRLALDLVAGRLALLEGHAGLRRVDRRALPGRARRACRGAAARAAHRQVRRRTGSRTRSPATTWRTRRSA